MNVGTRSELVGQMPGVARSRLDQKLSSIRHGVPRIQAKIEKRKLKLIAVDPNARKIASEIDGDSHVRIQRVRHHFDHALDHIGKHDGFRLEVLTAREREHALRQGGAAPGRLHGSAKPSRQARVFRYAIERHLEVGHHDHEQDC